MFKPLPDFNPKQFVAFIAALWLQLTVPRYAKVVER